MLKYFEKCLFDHLSLFNNIIGIQNSVTSAITAIQKCLDNNGKILFCGNGGSAADCQHLATEFVIRFEANRNPIAAIALTTDSSILTAASNDYDFTKIFSRQIQAIGNKNDILIALSTSGNSKNIIEAVKTARNLEIHSIGFSGQDGGLIADLCDEMIFIPSTNTARIQEAHIFIGHVICGAIEQNYLKK